MIARVLALALTWLACAAAREPLLVPDVSQRKIDIAYSFTGAELLLFGAILYPDGRFPQRDADVAVVVKGPIGSIRLWEKQRLLGLIWANADSTRFRSAPAYYAIASSRPIRDLVDERTAAIYELGLDNIQLSPAYSGDSTGVQRFEAGLIDLRRRSGLFQQQSDVVEITNGVLYRARISIPARVPTGTYTAETFLIRDGRVLAAATREIEIGKSGFERFVAQSAESQPLLYGLAAVLISLVMGWAASLVTRRV